MGSCLSSRQDEKELQEFQLLSTLDSNDVEWLSFSGICCRCKVVDVYDGDTITIILPYNKKYVKIKCRLTDIDCAEIRTRNGDEKKVGLKGKEFLSERILNKVIWIDCGNWDKFGRLLGKIYMTYDDYKNNKDINSELVRHGYGYFYDGKKKREFKDWSSQLPSD